MILTITIKNWEVKWSSWFFLPYSFLSAIVLQTAGEDVFDGWPTLVSSYVGVYTRISLGIIRTSPTVPARLIRLTWMVWEIGDKWLYCCCFVDICSKLHAVNLYTFHQAFFKCFGRFQVVQFTQLKLWRIPVFFYQREKIFLWSIICPWQSILYFI